jgi:hypothetical protein
VGAEVPCGGSAAKMEGGDEVTHGVRSGRRRREGGGPALFLLCTREERQQW